MNRRSFVQQMALAAGASRTSPRPRRTEHLIFIVNGGGVRKKEYCGDAALSPNITRLASEGYVFLEDHCERVSSHDAAFQELLQGGEAGARIPTLLDYIGNGIQIDSIRSIPQVMVRYKPRILVCRETGHDVGHTGYENYL